MYSPLSKHVHKHDSAAIYYFNWKKIKKNIKLYLLRMHACTISSPDEAGKTQHQNKTFYPQSIKLDQIRAEWSL